MPSPYNSQQQPQKGKMRTKRVHGQIGIFVIFKLFFSLEDDIHCVEVE